MYQGAPLPAPPTNIRNISQKWESQTVSICQYVNVTSHSWSFFLRTPLASEVEMRFLELLLNWITELNKYKFNMMDVCISKTLMKDDLSFLLLAKQFCWNSVIRSFAKDEDSFQNYTTVKCQSSDLEFQKK